MLGPGLLPLPGSEEQSVRFSLGSLSSEQTLLARPASCPDCSKTPVPHRGFRVHQTWIWLLTLPLISAVSLEKLFSFCEHNVCICKIQSVH